MIKCLAFDCFGTIFNMGGVPKEEIRAYVAHVHSNNFSPYNFPPSWWDLEAHPDSKAAIDELQRNNYWCVTLSNGSYDLLSHISKRAGINWDQVIDLVAHRVYKPNVDAYRVVEKETGYTPRETVMVTANPKFGDLEGAAAINMYSQVIRVEGSPTIAELSSMLSIIR